MLTKTVEQIERSLLGAMLVRKELITPVELEQALAGQHNSDKKLGELLVAKNLISQEKLERILVEQQIMLGQLLVEEGLLSQFS